MDTTRFTVTPTTVHDAVVIGLTPIRDDRGWFARTFCAVDFATLGLQPAYAQANASFNPYALTLRGMHWQDPPHAEVKVVRCTQGKIFDVVVDLRRDSPTYLRWAGVELSAENSQALYVPHGCAHGYLTLEPDSEVHYLVSAPYAPTHERGACWDDPAFAIKWPCKPALVSVRDSAHPPWER